MKKFRNIILAIFMSVYWPFYYSTSAYAALDSFNVVRLATATAGYSGANLEVPALVNAFKGATKALQWSTLSITPELGAAAIVKLASATAITAAAIYGPELVSYLYDKGYEYIQAELKKAVPVYQFPAGFVCQDGFTCVAMGYYATDDEAKAACVAEAGYWTGGYMYRYIQVSGTKILHYHLQGQGTATKEYTTPTETDLSALQTTIATDLTNSVPAATKLQKDILEAVKDIIENPSGALTVQNPAIANAVKTIVNSAVDAATKTNLETQADSPTAAQDYALAVSVNNASTLTKAEVETAIKNANAAKTAAEAADIAGASVSSMEPEQLPPTPTKLSLTAILTSYTSGLLNLPILSFLQNKGITTLSGSPDITIDFGSIIGLGNMGSATVGLGDYASTFQFMGNILLAITGWRWTLYIFEG